MTLSSLEQLSNEVAEFINVHLDLTDLNHIRLVSRTMSSLASQTHFGSFIRLTRVELTRTSLQSMIEMTAPGRIGCLIEELTLLGVVNNTAGLEYQLARGTKDMVWPDDDADEVLTEPQEPGSEADLGLAAAEVIIMKQRREDWQQVLASRQDIALLGQIFHNLAANTKLHGLTSLSTDVALYRQDSKTRLPAEKRLGWKLVWNSAVETFHTVIRSLAVSPLPIRRLNIFCNEYSGRCSLPCKELSLCNWQAPSVASTLAGLESLSISISDPILNEFTDDDELGGDPVDMLDQSRLFEETDLEIVRQQALDERNVIGISMLLEGCQQLRELDLGRCCLTNYHLDPRTLRTFPKAKYLQHLAETVRLPQLRRLTIGGFVVRGEDLLLFLKAHEIGDLSLVNIGLSSGDLSDIFEYCLSKGANMQALHFEDMSQGGKTALFQSDMSEGAPPIENSLAEGVQRGQNVHSRSSGDLAPIKWHFPRHTRLNPSPHVIRRYYKARSRFGPPW